MNRFILPLLVAAIGFAACGSGPSTTPGTGSPQEPAPPVTPEQVTGTEHLGWDQTASDPAEFAALRYAAYVDATRSELDDASCVPGQAEGAVTCSASLPPMRPGVHTIQLVAYFVGLEALESARSAPLLVQMTGAGTAVGATVNEGRHDPTRGAEDPVPPTLVTPGGLQLRVELVADGLVEPTDVAFAPDGRVFVAERAGRIRLVRDGDLQPAPAVALEDVKAGGDRGVLGLAVDPEFQRNHHVYALYTTPAGADAGAYRLVRFRETRDTLVEPAVLLDGVPASASNTAASMRFGPDGKLYVAFDDGGNPRLAGDMASFSGKVLRMNADGSTPDDQPAGTPVYSYEYRSPRGLAWQAGTGTLWVADSPRKGADRLTAVSALESRPKRARKVAGFDLPGPYTGVAGMSFYRGQLIPAFANELLVAVTPGGYILRLQFDSRNPLNIIAAERLPATGLGDVHMVAVGLDEAVYFCTDRALGRLVPASWR